MKKNLLVFGTLMLLAAASSMAMSLGRHRGAALIGRPLDISVQAVLDAQEDIASLCLEADVFYADNKLDKSRIRVTAEKSFTGSQEAVIRIRSSSLVDEPVVTLYLRVGCQQKTERRYVTLADMASDVLPERSGSAQIASPASVLPVGPKSVPASAAAPDAAQVAAKKPKKSNKTQKSEEIASNAGNAESATASKPDRAVKNKPNQVNRARLKLEPLDLSIDRDPQLKSSTELLSAPTINPQERSSAAALWQALNAQPQDILRDTQKLQTLEKSVFGLQAQSQKTQLSIDELGVKLQKAQSERYANPLVYALAALLLLAFAGAAYLIWGRFPRRHFAGGDVPWWRKNESSEDLRQSWASSGSSGDEIDHGSKAFSKSGRPALKKVPPDIDLTAGLPGAGGKPDGRSDFSGSKQTSNFDLDSMPPLGSKYRPDFALSMTHPSRAVKAEELFDVQQQADFFISIGQHDQAIEVLRSHIGEGVDTSALVYLDLFNLYHQLQREKDYSELREEFNRQFNTEIPTFDMYADTAPGLEAYQLAMSRIEALWPSPKVLEIIEESIFRKPNNNSEAFNLVAYRELLMLYSVAKEIISPESKTKHSPKKFDLPDTPAHSLDSRPMTFASTSIQPLSASIDEKNDAHPEALMESLFTSIVPPSSMNLGLDLDLSEPFKTQEKPGAMDASDADFFAQLAQHASLAISAMESPQAPANKTSLIPKSDNMIDFEVFDPSVGDVGKLKTPKA